MSDTIKILHLSDLHIGEEDDNIWCQLLKDDTREKKDEVNEFCKKIRDLNIGYIVITGDFVATGKDEYQHKKAFEILKKFCNKINFSDLNKVFIIPGNHDLNREMINNPNNYPKVMEFHKNYANAFYDNQLDRLYSNDYYKESLSGIDVSYKNKQKIYHNGKLSIIPLQTQFITPVYSNKKWEKIKSFILENCEVKANIDSKKMEFLWDNFDRGFLSDTQMRDIEQMTSSINIALMHHTPLPPSGEFSYDSFPDSNYLANGPNIIETLINKHINIILCGHIHKYDAYTFKNKQGKECLIIAAPTCGIDNDVGYNYIEINPEEFALNIKIISNFYTKNKDADNYGYTSKDYSFTLKNGLSYTPFLNFYDGVIKLCDTVLDDKSDEHTILHYFPRTEWKNYYEELLGEMKNNDDLFDSFLELYPVNAERKSKIREGIEDTVKNGYLSDKLVPFLEEAEFTKHLKLFLSENTRSENKFYKYLFDIWKNDPRDVNYFMENVRCAIEERDDFRIHKCIYFQKSGDKVIAKFKWLINSIIAAKNAKKNFNFSWLPFNIEELDEESLIEIRRKKNSQILFGFSHEGFNERKTVLFIDETTNDMEGGLIVKKIKFLVRKIIRPLSRYTLECFPFYRDGFLYIDNIKYVANKLEIPNEEMTKHEAELKKTFEEDRIKYSEKENAEKIEKRWKALKHWLWSVLQYEPDESTHTDNIKEFHYWGNDDI